MVNQPWFIPEWTCMLSILPWHVKYDTNRYWLIRLGLRWYGKSIVIHIWINNKFVLPLWENAVNYCDWYIDNDSFFWEFNQIWIEIWNLIFKFQKFKCFVFHFSKFWILIKMTIFFKFWKFEKWKMQNFIFQNLKFTWPNLYTDSLR